MPHVRLSGTYRGHKAGEIVDLTPPQLQEALRRQVAGKVYRDPIPTVDASKVKGGPVADKKAAPPQSVEQPEQ